MPNIIDVANINIGLKALEETIYISDEEYDIGYLLINNLIDPQHTNNIDELIYNITINMSRVMKKKVALFWAYPKIKLARLEYQFRFREHDMRYELRCLLKPL